MLILIDGGIRDAGLAEGIASFEAGGAYTAVVFTSLVATPGLGIVDAQFLASPRDVGFGEVGIGCEQLHAVPGAGLCGLVHGLDELGPAVGIESMVTPVIGHHDILQSVVLSKSGSYREHDTVAEGYDR